MELSERSYLKLPFNDIVTVPQQEHFLNIVTWL